MIQWMLAIWIPGSSQPRDWTQSPALQADSLPVEPQGKPKILEWVACPFSSGSSQYRNRTRVIAGGFFTNWGIREVQKWQLFEIQQPQGSAHKWKLLSCVRLFVCNPMDSTVHGILQARILEWVALPFSRGSSQPRDRTQVSRTAGRFFTTWATREAPLVFITFTY